MGTVSVHFIPAFSTCPSAVDRFLLKLYIAYLFLQFVA